MLQMGQGFQRTIMVEDELNESDIWVSQLQAGVNMQILFYKVLVCYCNTVKYKLDMRRAVTGSGC